MNETVPKQVIGNELIQEFCKSIPSDLFVAKDVQECYDIYRTVRTKLTKRKVEVPEAHLTGPLISLPIMYVIYVGEQKMEILRKYDEMRASLNRERKENSEVDQKKLVQKWSLRQQK